MRLVIGSGPGFKHEEGVIGLDYIKEFNPDVVRDIRKGLPFDDDKFDEINCEHTLEHIQLNEDFIFVMNEIWRVLKPGGTVYIEVPHKDSEMAYESIEHTRFFSRHTFVNFYDNPYAKEMGYPLFKPVSVSVGERGQHKILQVCLQK
jgi:predicted SAM-dependent methyltransferase